MAPSDDEPTLVRVSLVLCSLCLSGAGGQCHMPGCALWMKAAPDVPIVDFCETFEPVEAT